MSRDDRCMVSMEEGRREKIESRSEEAGETSGSSDQIVENDKESNAMGYSLSSKAKVYLKSLDNARNISNLCNKQQPTKRRIPKVPDMMRNNQNFNKYFEPSLVSIGPYHHKNQNLKVTQEIKLKLAAMFIEKHAVNEEDLFLHISKEMADLRNCYQLDATQCYGNDDLAWIFLIDGCIVLHFLCVHKKVKEAKNKFERLEIFEQNGLDVLKGYSEITKFVTDLVLLENQLPYPVLKLVINSSKDSEMLMDSIQHWFMYATYNRPKQMQLPPEDASHLLDLLRKILIKSASFDKKSNFITRTLENYSIKIIDTLFTILSYLTFVLLHILHLHPSFSMPSLRNVMELKAAGIELKCSGTNSLEDVSFSRGTLKLPSIFVNKVTPFTFLNLVAYETCLNSPDNKFEVSAYIYLLASLIVQPEDVKELCKNKILLHFVDSDEEVVKIFHEIRTYDMIEAFGENYSDILTNIHNHCSKKYNAWIAQLKSNYFQSPWSLIALIGATIALLVTILQTVYTVLSYYKYGSAPVSSSRNLPST